MNTNTADTKTNISSDHTHEVTKQGQFDDTDAIMAYVRTNSELHRRGTPYGVVIATLNDNDEIVIGWSRSIPQQKLLVPIGKINKKVIYSYETIGDAFDKNLGFQLAIGRALNQGDVKNGLPDDENLRAKLGYIARTSLRYFKQHKLMEGQGYEELLAW